MKVEYKTLDEAIEECHTSKSYIRKTANGYTVYTKD